MTADRGFKPRALGEVAIRCRDFVEMSEFYERVLGLERLRAGERGGHRDGIAFFRLNESHAGHVAVLALFADDATPPTSGPAAGPGSSLHHLALSLPWDEQDAAAEWLRSHGHTAEFVDFGWVGWRGVFTRDPDGNTVELVAADPEWHLT